MFRIQCFTNLDLGVEEWPRMVDALPPVGSYIQSATKHGHFQLELEVVAIRLKKSNTNEWNYEIELTDRKIFKRSIKEFYEWYAPKIGKTVSYFI
jgi:hypothetical protein